MKIRSKYFPGVRALLVSCLTISLITACSGTKNAQFSNQNNPARGALAASSRVSVEVPKSDPSIEQPPTSKSAPQDGNEQSLAMTQPESEPVAQPQLEASMAEELVIEQSTGVDSLVQSAPEPLAAVPDPEQTIPKAEVDLSLPAQPQVGFRAPDFSLQTLDGQALRLADVLGRPVVINYWATWCIPCKQELPILEKLNQEYSSKGITFLSVNAIDQDSMDKVQSLVSELGMTFPVLLDQGRQFADVYQAIFFPTTYLVDAHGVIREVNLGDNTEEELRTSLEKLLVGEF